MLLPYQHPLRASPHAGWGCTHTTSVTKKFHQAGTSPSRCVWMEWSWPPRCLPRCPGGEVAKRMERRREGRHEGLSGEPTKCLGGSLDPRSEGRP